MARPELASVFEHLWLPVGEDGKRQRGVLARCGKCDAAITTPVNTMAKGGSQTDEIEWKFISSKLGMQGWDIGRRRRDHRCPRCQRNARLEAPREAQVYAFESKKTGLPLPPGNMQLVRDAFMNSTTPTTVLPPKSITNTPRAGESAGSRERHPPGHDGRDLPAREMTREDRRLIFEKLNEVYVDDKVGYGDGWSDEKVASDLGVPRGWVKLIRDENFGEEITSEITRKKVEEAHALLDKIKALQPAIDDARKLLGLADKMAQELAQIAKVMK